MTLRAMAEANGWEALTDGSLGPERQELQAAVGGEGGNSGENGGK